MPAEPDAVFLGRVLRRARIAAGIKSQDELANILGYERTAIAKAESGYRPPSPELASAYARRFPELNALIESGLIEEWSAFAREASGTGSFPKYFGKFIDAEKDASGLFYWAPSLVPGIRQTEQYARAILAKEPSTDPLETRVADRMARQRVLLRDQPPYVSIVLAEAVLHRCVGDPEIMCDQLTVLADSENPRVIVQVIPADVGAHAGLEGAASIAEQEGGPTIVYLESLTAGQTTGEPGIVARVREITALLRAEALPQRASRDRIMKVAEEWKTK
jgi:DNA-binding XRE family transcriptional regulator